MSRSATGTVDYRANPERPGEECWCARYTRADGTRTKWLPLPGNIAPDDEAGARKIAASYAPLARVTTRDGKGQSVADYSIRWIASCGPRRALDAGIHLRKHVLPVIGHVSILALTARHGDEVVGALDAKIAAGTMSDATARGVWSTIKKLLRDAAHAKPSTGLRCLESSPFRDVMPPNRSKAHKGHGFVYPSELISLVTSPDVPARWKRNVSIAIFLGLRYAEQRALRWEHVDLDHGIVHVGEVFDRLSKAVRSGTKSGAARVVPIPAPLMPLLRAMHDSAGGTGLVCPDLASAAAMARGLRTWLRKAGVTRESLHTESPVNMPLRWHDLRATCGTWMAVQGRDPTEIRDVLGHSKVTMTDRYLRSATAVRGGSFGEPFPALPALTVKGHSIVMTANAPRNLPESEGNSASNRAA